MFYRPAIAKLKPKGTIGRWHRIQKHTAGVAALILSVEPNLTCDEVRHYLEQSAKDLGDPGRDDYYGSGRVDARAALDMVLAKRADLNNDWRVDEDESILMQAIDTNDLSADIAPAGKPDGVVDELDLELLIQYWEIEIPEIGLIAHWKLDETEGETAYDSVATNDSIVIGEAIWQPENGIVDGAIQFNGVDDYIETPFILNAAERSFSVLAWVQGGASGQVIVSQQGAANWLMVDAEGNLMTDLKGTGRSGQPLQSQTLITDGNWHRMGLVWDGLNRTLYVDDLVVAKDTQNGLESSDNGLYIGCGKNMEPETYWSGLIDDIRIYNRTV